MSDRPVAMVTGASRGIGAATCIEFARRGYNVALMARSQKPMEAVAEQVREHGGDAMVHAGDLADLDYARAAIDQTAQRWGRIDALINNAAWRELGTMRKITLETWERTLRINLTSPAFLARWAASHMERVGRGVIINISSVQSRLVSGFGPAYIAAKGALDALTYELAALYGPVGIRVVSLRPGAIDTEMSGDYTDASGQNLSQKVRTFSEDMIPQRRWGQAAEIARTIAWLASDDAAYITGTTLCADGGLEHNYMPYSLKALVHPDDFQS